METQSTQNVFELGPLSDISGRKTFADIFFIWSVFSSQDILLNFLSPDILSGENLPLCRTFEMMHITLHYA